MTLEIGGAWSSPRKRKTKKQRMKEKGRRNYQKGKEFEHKVDPLLRREGYHVLPTRVHSKGLKEEFDRVVADDRGRLYGVEIKATKQKAGTTVVKKLKKKVRRHKGLLHGAILVSRSGVSKSAEKDKDVKILKYKQKRKKRTTGFSLF